MSYEFKDLEANRNGTEDSQHPDLLSTDTDYFLSLKYPYSRPGRQAEQVPLAVKLAELQAEVDQASLGGDGYNVPPQMALAEKVGYLVHKTLWFSPGNFNKETNKNVPPAMSELEADCYTHTWLASKCMAHVGIDHLVAYVNGHAGIVVRSGEEAHFINPSNPRLSQNLRNYTTLGLSPQLAEELAQYGRSATMFRAAGFGAKDQKFDSNLPDYSWLKYDRSDRFVMSVFPAEIGRKMLEIHLEYKRALAVGDLVTAAHSVVALGTNYPELDARNTQDMDDIRLIIKHLSNSGSYELAQKVIAARFSATELSQDARFAVAQARCHEIIAKAITQNINPSEVFSGGDRQHAILSLGQFVCKLALGNLQQARDYHTRADPFSRRHGFFLDSIERQRKYIEKLGAKLIVAGEIATP